ncbi:MAG TPA: LamG-like jellyroll fold domain-containing protein, partial [Mucilaginibacter sp.]|nr:LamG-like jellyroll fold domain-containing protein [Mucilaginibacter sp.]
GATNLVAHWTFDSDNKEVISGTAPSNTYGTAGSTTGQLGNALQLTAGALVYPAIDKINSANALNNFTVSMWVNVKGNKGLTPNGFMSFFSLIPTTVSDVWPDITLAAETGQYIPTSDTLKLKPLFNTHPVGGGNSLQDNVAQKNTDPADATHPNGQTGAFFKGAGKWSHYVAKWDASTGKFYIFANGVSVGGFTTRTPNPGNMIMATPVKAVIGSLAASDIGFASAPGRSFNVLATASIDDIRVFNTALPDKDITALFNLGTAGR